MPRRSLSAALLLAALSVSACGGQAEPSSTVPAAPRAEDFPAGGSPQLAALTRAGSAGRPQLAPSVAALAVGTNRYAFALFDASGRQLQGSAAVYVASPQGSQVRGPYPARLESLEVDARFASRTSAQTSSDIRSVYVAQVPFEHNGRRVALAVARVGGRLVASSPAPLQVGGPAPVAVGAPAPRISTPTVASANGDVESIETRVPPDDMHRTDFADVVGRRPVVLTFATPQLCQSRVCAPVVDEVAQLQAQFGDRAEFIHMEVYRDNRIEAGIRPQLRAFRLPSEPWVFVIDARGRVAARVEGAASVRELREAIERGLA